MRTIKITAGMIPEFEIIKTNASDETIVKQLEYNCYCEENGINVDPYGILDKNGYNMELLSIQDDEFLYADRKVDG